MNPRITVRSETTQKVKTEEEGGDFLLLNVVHGPNTGVLRGGALLSKSGSPVVLDFYLKFPDIKTRRSIKAGLVVTEYCDDYGIIVVKGHPPDDTSNPLLSQIGHFVIDGYDHCTRRGPIKLFYK